MLHVKLVERIEERSASNALDLTILTEGRVKMTNIEIIIP